MTSTRYLSVRLRTLPVGFVRRIFLCCWNAHRGPFHDGQICLSCYVEFDFGTRRWTYFPHRRTA